MAALAVGVPWSFVVLPLIDTGNAALFALAIAGTYASPATAYGPMAAFIPEIFGTRYRYSGAGLALNLAGLVGGAVPTIVAAPLLATWGVPAIGVMMATVVLVSLVCTAHCPRRKALRCNVSDRLSTQYQATTQRRNQMNTKGFIRSAAASIATAGIPAVARWVRRRRNASTATPDR